MVPLGMNFRVTFPAITLQQYPSYWGQKLLVNCNVSKKKDINHYREAFLSVISMADARIQATDSLRLLGITFPTVWEWSD